MRGGARWTIAWTKKTWDTFDKLVPPVVDIFSEQGAFERDSGPYRYTRDDLGLRATGNTYEEALALGFCVGVPAETDDHLGVPRAYVEGLTVELAVASTRESVTGAARRVVPTKRVASGSGRRHGQD